MMSSIPSSFDPLGTSNTIILPPGYTRVNYLESTGTQYIDTLQMVDATTKWEVVFENTQKSSFEFTGVYTGSNTEVFSLSYFVASASGPKGYATQWWNNSILRSGYDVDGPVLASLDSLNEVTVLGPYSTKMTGIRDVPTNSLYLYARSRNSSGYDMSIGHWKYWKSCIWKNGVLVQHLIPTLDPTNRPCMFDLVTKTPFYNKGSG